MRVPAELDVTICGRCGAYFLGSRWHRSAGEDPVVSAVRAATLSAVRLTQLTPDGMKLLQPHEAPGIELSIEPRPEEGVVWVRARGKIHRLQAETQLDEATIKLSLKRVMCDVCRLRSARHYEAVLQVRGRLTGERRSEIRSALERLVNEESQREREAFISNVEEMREGLDFYVNPAGLARRMAALLRSGFGAKVRESAKLIGQTKEGRKRFRLSILARLPDEGSY
jgi:nonsense-mediated mRNA decay protein 3